MAKKLAGAPIEAIVACSHSSGFSAAHDGIVRGGSSILGSRYAVDRGIDLDDRRLRADLLQAWCVLTPTEMVFCTPSQWSVRPKPGPIVDRLARSGTTLRWADIVGLSSVSRMIHLEFADGRHLLTGTLVGSRIGTGNHNDEPDLFVRAFGSDAVEVDLT